MVNKFRLTQMVNSAGCAAKINPQFLNKLLNNFQYYKNKNVLIDFSGRDDAGIYKLMKNKLLIQTIDFFPPVIDDPYIFGMIAVSNSLSDIYAMGGKPLSALNIVGFPVSQNPKILNLILKGGNKKARESLCPIIGGHSIDINTIIYGLSVTGETNIKSLKRNNGCKVGDLLILTKPLGIGIMNNSLKYGNPPSKYKKELIKYMLRLNKCASELMVKYNASACTDVTGFGLAGHAYQMAHASNVMFKINLESLPLLPGVKWAINNNFLTRCDKTNSDYTIEYLKFENTKDDFYKHIIFDPQTSGGLLISVKEKNAFELLNYLIEYGDDKSKIIGCVEKCKNKKLRIIFHT